MTSTTTERATPSHGATRRAAAHRRRTHRTLRRAGWTVGAIAAIAGLVALVLALAGGTSGAPDESGTAIDVGLGDYFISGDLTAAAGRVQLDATNIGREPHDVGIVGGKISTTLFAGQSTTLDLGELEPGTYQLFCDVSDHVARGMVATLTVTEPVPAPAP